MERERGVGITTAPGGTWVQVERAAMERWAILVGENPRAASVMMLLVSKMGRHNAIVASQNNLARLSNCSVRTLQRSLEVLRENNWIDVRQIGPNGTINAYIINDRVAWSGNRDGRRYSLFSATILVSDDEQPDQAELDALEELERIPEMFLGEMQLPTGPGLPPPSSPAIPGLEHDLPATRRDDGEAS